ncbi:DUF2125 domain-containing protein [uncultured Tateyamaria sp.]|uniref:DUF2125 domain-containing protein n=1 Tax=uncultured Tateyamaria sp. TaxID=455651 RepID=UPI002629ADB0|nr:DUF2125 domain-containing protein [uncultured Tateyamaria sp.]
MRKILWVILLAGLAWCGWWFAASSGMRGAVAAWFDARSAEGWQAEVGTIEGGGFPMTLSAGLRDIAVADPAAGVAVETAALDITAPAWWPGDVTVTLDEGPILLASPLGRSTLTMQDGVMALALHPGTALELEQLGWTAGPWQVRDGAATQMSAESLTLTMTQTDGATYDLVAFADAFAPGDAIRAALRLPDSIPQAFESLRMQATVGFDTPWDRRALDQARPQPRVIDLHLAEAIWGDVVLNLSADLTVDVAGVPDGTVTLQAENWLKMLDLAQAAGILPPQFRGQAEGLLGMLAGASGNEETLDVELTLSGGAVRLGFIPLGPAPRLIIR